MVAYNQILLFAFLPTVLSYYFYNPLTNQIVYRSSTKIFSDGYELLPAPKNFKRNNRGRQYDSCTDAGFSCTTPYPRSQTFQFECDHDSQCPQTYKCCPQKCFEHKICAKSSSGPPPNGNDNFERPGTCEKWPYNCHTPYDYYLTAVFRCTSDRACPKGFKCCEQNCFAHRICSRARETPEGPSRRGAESSTEHLCCVAQTTETTESENDESEDDDEVTVDTTEVATDNTEYVTTYRAEQVATEEEEEEATIYRGEEVATVITEVTDELEETTFSTTLQSGRDEDNLITSTLISGMSTVSKNEPTAPDNNAIIPEYEDYYYHYGEGNITDTQYQEDQ